MTGARVPSVAEYARYYGVARRHLENGILIMHPGPVNRGVEISGDVVLDGSSLIAAQVAAGTAVRSAVRLFHPGPRQNEAMPELPEVETIRRQLEPEVVGRQIERAEVLDERWTRPELPAATERALPGRRIEAVGRRGKYLVVRLDAAITAESSRRRVT